MEINRKNYESWFLDYHEGTLAPEKVAELFAFLEENPDLRNEFDEFEMFNINEELPTVTFEEKESLHKELTEDEIRIWMLDILEGNRSDKSQLISFLQNKPALLEEWKLLQLTILNIDKNDVFASKSLLKKNELLPAGYEELIIGSLENELNLQQRVELNNLLKQYPSLEKEKELFAATYSRPEQIEYPFKNQLRKKDAKIIAFTSARILSLAAALILILGAWFILNREAELPVQVANNNNEVKTSAPAQPEKTNSGTTDIKSENKTAGATPVQSEKKASGSSGKSASPFIQKEQQQNTVKQNSEPVFASAVKNKRNNTHTNFIQSDPDKKNQNNTDPSVTDNSQIELMAERKAYIQEEEPFADVMRRPYFGKTEAEENRFASLPDEVKNVVNTAENKVEKVTENTPLAANVNGTRLTLGSRVFRSLAWVVGKASDDRIKIKTTINPLTGNLAACEVETANRKWQKQF